MSVTSVLRYRHVGLFVGRRSAWKNLSMALGANFQVGAYAKKLSETVLREARAEHDLLINGGKKRDAPSTPSTVDAGAGKNVRNILFVFYMIII